MPALLQTKGELYFFTRSEMEKCLELISDEIPESGINANWRDLKLSITTSEAFSGRRQTEKVFTKAAEFATAGMVLIYHDNSFQDVICANRDNNFNAKRPAVLVFTLREFEDSFGKLDYEIPDVVYDSPFYIYEQSLKKKGPKFSDELPISDEECTLGFEIDMIWLKYVSQSETSLYKSLFKPGEETEEDYVIQSLHGFAPGYSMEGAIAEAKKVNFLVYTWDEYWNK